MVLRLFFVSIVVLFGLMATSQSKPVPNKYKTFKRTIIAGNLPNKYQNLKATVVLSISDLTNPMSRGRNDTLTIDNGLLCFEYFFEHPVMFSVLINGKNAFSQYNPLDLSGIFIEPGDSIHMAFNDHLKVDQFSDFFVLNSIEDVVKFSGRGIVKYLCIQNISKKIKQLNANVSVLRAGRKWILYADSVENEAYKIIDRFKKKLSHRAFVILKAEIASLVYLYSLRHIYQPNNDSTVRWVFQKKVANSKTIINPYVQYAYGYGNFLISKEMFKYLSSKGILYNGFGNWSYGMKEDVCYRIIDSVYKYPLKEWLLSKYLVNKSIGMSKQRESCIKDFLLFKDKQSPYYKHVEQFYMVWKNELSKGAPSYNFHLPDTSGKKLSQTDFWGKVVLIDFMLKGCVPCLQMAKMIHTIETLFKDKTDVTFISISVDKDITKWKEGIGKFSAPGSIQLYTEGKGAAHPIIDYYQVSSYPTLILIDKEGKIISARPPNPIMDEGKELIKLINKYRY